MVSSSQEVPWGEDASSSIEANVGPVDSATGDVWQGWWIGGLEGGGLPPLFIFVFCVI